MTPDMMTDNLARAQDTIARLTAQLAAANARAEHSENLLCRLFNASPVFNRDSLYQDMKEEILALRDKPACVAKTAETAPQPDLCSTSEPQTARAVTVREAKEALMVESIDSVPRSCKLFGLSEPHFRAALRAIAGGNDD